MQKEEALMTPIKENLRVGVLPQNLKKARKLKLKAAEYVLEKVPSIRDRSAGLSYNA